MGTVLIDSFPIFRPFPPSAGETVGPGRGEVGPESVPDKERKKADENHSLCMRVVLQWKIKIKKDYLSQKRL